LKNRIALQTTHRQYLLLADTQALTDNAHNPDRVRDNVLEIATDYLAVGIDPNETTICLQSASSGIGRFDATVHELCHGGAA
jgi:tryptophanyl-tRNA synthetase